MLISTEAVLTSGTASYLSDQNMKGKVLLDRIKNGENTL